MPSRTPIVYGRCRERRSNEKFLHRCIVFGTKISLSFCDGLDGGIVQIQPDGSMSEIIPALYCIPYMEYSDMIVAAPWRVFRGKRKPGHFGVFSLRGELLIPFEYDEIRLGDDPERIAVCKGDKWFFINLKNERILF